MTRKRRDPYERALNAAKKDLEKSIQDRDRIEKRLAEIQERIPHLQMVIAALGAKQPYVAGQEPPPIGESTVPETVVSPALTHPGLPGGVPAHLEKYLRRVIRPPTAQAVEVPPAPDEEDNLPAIPGEPILE